MRESCTLGVRLCTLFSKTGSPDCNPLDVKLDEQSSAITEHQPTNDSRKKHAEKHAGEEGSRQPPTNGFVCSRRSKTQPGWRRPITPRKYGLYIVGPHIAFRQGLRGQSTHGLSQWHPRTEHPLPFENGSHGRISTAMESGSRSLGCRYECVHLHDGHTMKSFIERSSCVLRCRRKVVPVLTESMERLVPTTCGRRGRDNGVEKERIRLNPRDPS